MLERELRVMLAMRQKQPGLPAIAMTGLPAGEVTGLEEFPDVRLLNKPMTRTMLMRAVGQAVKPVA